MKNNFLKLFLVCFISFGSLITMSAAEAYNCKWVGGYHNKYGNYVPKHKVCNNGHKKCKWVRGHRNQYGHYVPSHKVCYSKYWR